MPSMFKSNLTKHLWEELLTETVLNVINNYKNSRNDDHG